METRLLNVLFKSHPHWFRSKERAGSLDRDNGDPNWGSRPTGSYIVRFRWRCLFLFEIVIFQLFLPINNFVTFYFYCFILS